MSVSKIFVLFKQKTAYEMRIRDWSSDVCSSDLLMALAITDDHKAQEAAFYEAPQWQRSAESLRDHLTCEEIDASSDEVARFVGVEACEAAGGGRKSVVSGQRVEGRGGPGGCTSTTKKHNITTYYTSLQQS